MNKIKEQVIEDIDKIRITYDMPTEMIKDKMKKYTLRLVDKLLKNAKI